MDIEIFEESKKAQNSGTLKFLDGLFFRKRVVSLGIGVVFIELVLGETFSKSKFIYTEFSAKRLPHCFALIKLNLIHLSSTSSFI